MFRGGRRRGAGLGTMLLASQVMRMGVNNIPPITLATLAVNCAIFYDFLTHPYLSARASCISLLEVYYNQDFKRLVLGALVHGDEWHLYYNMVSFLFKGRTLENQLGSPAFAFLLSVFTCLTGVVLVGLNYAAAEFLHDTSYYHTCAIGFSGVIFALKVLTTFDQPPGSRSYIMGIPVPSRYACWAELFIIHLLHPGTSFAGHLAGILVGLAYVMGPLKYVMNMFGGSGSSAPSYRSRQRFTGGGVPTGHRPWSTSSHSYSPGSDTNSGPNDGTAWGNHHSYSGGMSEEEQLREAVRRSEAESANNSRQQQDSHMPSSEEDLRQRRLRRFAQET